MEESYHGIIPHKDPNTMLCLIAEGCVPVVWDENRRSGFSRESLSTVAIAAKAAPTDLIPRQLGAK